MKIHYLKYVDVQDNRYPFFNANSLQTAYYLEKSFVDKLKNFNDERLFEFAQKKPNAITSDVNDFSAYGGLYGSNPSAENEQKAINGEASRIDERFYSDPINEPSLLMSYSELQFTLAEAAARGWISGSTDNFYKAGIKASMNFYGITDVDTYLNQPAIQLQNPNDIENIMIQKHISMFMNTGYQIFYDQRRTGFPEFNVDGGGILNNGQIPKRFMYPEDERANNTQNLEEAVADQFGNSDDINGVIWLLE